MSLILHFCFFIFVFPFIFVSFSPTLFFSFSISLCIPFLSILFFHCCMVLFIRLHILILISLVRPPFFLLPSQFCLLLLRPLYTLSLGSPSSLFASPLLSSQVPLLPSLFRFSYIFSHLSLPLSLLLLPLLSLPSSYIHKHLPPTLPVLFHPHPPPLCLLLSLPLILTFHLFGVLTLPLPLSSSSSSSLCLCHLPAPSSSSSPTPPPQTLSEYAHLALLPPWDYVRIPNGGEDAEGEIVVFCTKSFWS